MRAGKWRGEESEYGNLPPDIREHVSAAIEGVKVGNIDWGEVDWLSFMGSDGNMWLIAKLWVDEDSYEVIAATVAYRSSLMVI